MGWIRTGLGWDWDGTGWDWDGVRVYLTLRLFSGFYGMDFYYFSLHFLDGKIDLMTEMTGIRYFAGFVLLSRFPLLHPYLNSPFHAYHDPMTRDF